MSLILDALRKMEQDRNSRRGAGQNIRPEVLRYRGTPSPQGKRSYLPVVIGSVLLLCCVGAGLLLKGHRAASVSQETAPPAPVAPIASSQPATIAEPVAPATPVPSAVPAPPAVAAPVAAPVAEPRALSVPAVPAVPAVSARTKTGRQPVADAQQSRPGPDREARPKPVRRAAAVSLRAAPADLTISGIAWQDEHSLRRAVVNGSLVGEGAEVAGARVVEIREDRVWLSRDGQVFEAVLSSGASR